MSLGATPGVAARTYEPRRRGRGEAPALAVHGLTRRFGEIAALSDADLEVFSGEIHAVLGENGAEVDVLVMPTTKVVAPPREEAGRYLLRLSENCIPWSLGEFCAVSAFMGMSDGLPTGLQLVGRPGADAEVLAIAHGFEQAAPAT